MVQVKKVGVAVITWMWMLSWGCAQQSDMWLEFHPKDGNNTGKQIVLISGDEEYRSEEYLPMLAKILTTHHGFKTRVLFAVDPQTGLVDPTYTQNIPGMEHLETADLLIIAIRFRELPDEQMKYLEAYLDTGKPVIGLRTATHAFNYDKNSNSAYTKYSYSSDEKDWQGGFGQRILGETWISHHGVHGSEGTRGLINGFFKSHPIVENVEDIWGPTDVYTVENLSEEAKVLVWGQSTQGMTAESPVNLEKSIMPVAWIQSYEGESGKKGRVFTTTMGSAIDFLSEDLRRLVVNACYWSLEIERTSSEKTNVEIVGNYQPTMFGFGDFKKNKRPKDFEN